MSYTLTVNELRTIAKIQVKLFFPVNQSKTTIFLCGADIKNIKTARARMAEILRNPRFSLLYPEDIFTLMIYCGRGITVYLNLKIF